MKRQYQMVARAEQAEATGRRILEATLELTRERWIDEVTLQAVADRAGVSLQTVIRRYGSREGLFQALIESHSVEVERNRARAPIDDAEASVGVLCDEYERDGDAVMRLLGAETRDPVARSIVGFGRDWHQEWVARTFPSWLEGLDAAARRRRRAQLVVATDVYTWKLLRRDHGLSKAETARAMLEMIHNLKEGDG